MLIYRSPRAVRVHTALALSRRRMSSYRMAIALATTAATMSVAACYSTSTAPSNPIIGFNPQSITLTTVPGGSATGAVSVVNTTGTALFGLIISVGTYSGNSAGWLTASLAGEATPTPLTLTADATNLAPGNYSATVNVSATDARPPTATLTVKLNVTP